MPIIKYENISNNLENHFIYVILMNLSSNLVSQIARQDAQSVYDLYNFTKNIKFNLGRSSKIFRWLDLAHAENKIFNSVYYFSKDQIFTKARIDLVANFTSGLLIQDLILTRPEIRFPSKLLDLVKMDFTMLQSTLQTRLNGSRTSGLTDPIISP